MTERYVFVEYEAPSGTDTFHIADLVQEANPRLQMELIDTGFFVLLTELPFNTIQELVWPHNSGLLCEACEINEDQYDALC